MSESFGTRFFYAPHGVARALEQAEPSNLTRLPQRQCGRMSVILCRWVIPGLALGKVLLRRNVLVVPESSVDLTLKLSVKVAGQVRVVQFDFSRSWLIPCPA